VTMPWLRMTFTFYSNSGPNQRRDFVTVQSFTIRKTKSG
jgi:hypothetical protein